MNLDDAAAALAGVWLLVEYRDRASADEPWSEPYGSNPTGMIVYDPSGYLSVHVHPGPDAPPDSEYLGYFGTWSVAAAHPDGAAIVGVVLHAMSGASAPFLLDDPPERLFRLEGDTLFICDDAAWRRRLVRATS